MRDLASRTGITPPTVYAYFASKNDIFDAMFGQSAIEFDRTMAEPYDVEAPREQLAASVRRFFAFCTEDHARYQLLFQRVLPGFAPSAASYAPAVHALEGARRLLARNGLSESRHLDLWTALLSGLIAQQVSNDPGGTRWTRLTDDAVAMFLAHFGAQGPTTRHHDLEGTER